jgi:hypothetical protein
MKSMEDTARIPRIGIQMRGGGGGGLQELVMGKACREDGGMS